MSRTGSSWAFFPAHIKKPICILQPITFGPTYAPLPHAASPEMPPHRRRFGRPAAIVAGRVPVLVDLEETVAGVAEFERHGASEPAVLWDVRLRRDRGGDDGVRSYSQSNPFWDRIRSRLGSVHRCDCWLC